MYRSAAPHDERAGDAGDTGAEPAVDDLRFFGLRAASGSENDDGGNDGESDALPPASASAGLDGAVLAAVAALDALKFVLPASASAE